MDDIRLVFDYSCFDSNSKGNAWKFVREIFQAQIHRVFENENFEQPYIYKDTAANSMDHDSKCSQHSVS
jgi:hypothetical protein